jgi:transglutaminase-like putative cysteine protease
MVATTPEQAAGPSWLRRLEIGSLLPGALLAALMLWCVFQSVEGARWAAGIDMLTGIALLALLVGVAFARLGWMSPWLAHPLAAALGVALAVQRSGPALLREVEREFGASAAGRLTTWPDLASEIAIRATIWLRILGAGGRGEDIVLFIVVLALLAWALGYLTGWLVFRSHQTWLAVALSGVIILINYTFTFPKPDTLFFVFLAAALLLLVYQNIAEQQQLWRAVHIEFPDFLPGRFLLAAALVCVVLIAGTALLPGTVTSVEAARAWQAIRQPFSSAREAWNDAFSTINAPPGTSGSFVLRGVSVGGPRQLGEDEVMRVSSERYEYWRAVAFDRYNGRLWQSTVGERARAALGLATAEEARSPLDPGQPLEQTELGARELITQTFTLAQSRSDGLLMVGGQLNSASLPALIQHGYVEARGEQLPNFTETASAITDVALEASLTYSVTAYVATVDEQSLRQAGQSYPGWVQGAYLQLPEALPARVRELAAQVVREAGAENPYDQALAIQAHLRTLPYDEGRPAPPEGLDWADHFLFVGRRGYCDDFATAMVVMLRSQGIPARWVQGYAGGALDPDSGDYIVRESVAHSWVEAYFPGYGWQRFEPTPAPYASVPVRPALPEPEGSDEEFEAPEDNLGTSTAADMMRELEDQMQDGGASDPEAVLRELEAMRARERLRQLAAAGGALAILVGLVGLAWLALDWRLRGLSPAQAAFARLARLGALAGLPQPPEATPHEYGGAVKRAVAGGAAVDRIVEAYVAERYSPEGKPRASAEELGRAWGEVRPALLRRMLAGAGERLRPRR